MDVPPYSGLPNPQSLPWLHASRKHPCKIILCNTFLCIMCIIRQHRRIGPKISSPITASAQSTSVITVGAIRKVFFVILPAADSLFRIHQSQQSVKMLFVDDFSIIRILQGIFSKLPRDLLSDSFHQLIPDLAIAQNIIRCHAGLPAIQIFSEHDPPGRQRDLCRSIHDAGLFPPSSSVTGVKYSAALLSTSRPTILPPVKISYQTAAAIMPDSPFCRR